MDRSSNYGGPPELSHSQVQTLLASIGAEKGLRCVGAATGDRARLDWSIARTVRLAMWRSLPGTTA